MDFIQFYIIYAFCTNHALFFSLSHDFFSLSPYIFVWPFDSLSLSVYVSLFLSRSHSTHFIIHCICICIQINSFSIYNTASNNFQFSLIRNFNFWLFWLENSRSVLNIYIFVSRWTAKFDLDYSRQPNELLLTTDTLTTHFGRNKHTNTYIHTYKYIHEHTKLRANSLFAATFDRHETTTRASQPATVPVLVHAFSD